MACMCGDTCCPSCGPAQGNWKCPICYQWADAGCVHIDDETGEIKAEFKDAAETAMKNELAAEEEYYRQMQEWEEDE